MYGIYKKEVLMSRSKKEMDLTVGDPFRSLLKFAIPVILGNLFQLFYNSPCNSLSQFIKRSKIRLHRS